MADNDTKIAVLQNQMNNVEKKVDEGFRDARDEMVKLNTKLDLFIESAESKFASKWVETTLARINWIIIIAIIGAILSLVVITNK
jgi:hypothetical protein